jgi:hypothetical protein
MQIVTAEEKARQVWSSPRKGGVLRFSITRLIPPRCEKPAKFQNSSNSEKDWSHRLCEDEYEPPICAAQFSGAFERVWDAQFLLRATPTLGLPALTVSTGLVGQIPVGVQIVANRYREDLCLCAGEAIEARGTPPAPIDPRN